MWLSALRLSQTFIQRGLNRLPFGAIPGQLNNRSVDARRWPKLALAFLGNSQKEVRVAHIDRTELIAVRY